MAWPQGALRRPSAEEATKMREESPCPGGPGQGGRLHHVGADCRRRAASAGRGTREDDGLLGQQDPRSAWGAHGEFALDHTVPVARGMPPNGTARWSQFSSLHCFTRTRVGEDGRRRSYAALCNAPAASPHGAIAVRTGQGRHPSSSDPRPASRHSELAIEFAPHSST